jgi:hypothetical protein
MPPWGERSRKIEPETWERLEWNCDPTSSGVDGNDVRIEDVRIVSWRRLPAGEGPRAEREEAWILDQTAPGRKITTLGALFDRFEKQFGKTTRQRWRTITGGITNPAWHKPGPKLPSRR